MPRITTEIDIFQTPLIAAFGHKVAKTATAAVSTVREAVRQFGPKALGAPSMKALLAALPELFNHGDAGVRSEAMALAVELYRWLAAGIRTKLQELRPAQLKEFDEACGTRGGGRAVLTRAGGGAAAEGGGARRALAALAGARCLQRARRALGSRRRARRQRQRRARGRRARRGRLVRPHGARRPRAQGTPRARRPARFGA